MEPTDYLRIIRRRWSVVVILLLVGLAIGYFTANSSATNHSNSGTAATSYQATAILATSSATTADPSGLSLDTIAFLAQSGPVASMTAKAVGDNAGGADITGHVQLNPKDSLNLLEATASEPTRDQAVQLANAFASQLIAYINDQLQVTYQANLATDHNQLDALTKLISSLQTQPPSPLTQGELGVAQSQYAQLYVSYQQLLLAGPQHTLLHVINPAAPNATTVVQNGGIAHAIASAGKKSRVALGGIAGLIIGVGLALIRDRFDTRVQTREQAEEFFGLPVLGEIPRLPLGGRTRGLVVAEAPSSGIAESIRMLQTVLALSSPAGASRGRPRAILISCPLRVESKATLIANLAASFSEEGNSVALVLVDPFDVSLLALIGGSTRGTQSGGLRHVDVTTAPELVSSSIASPTAIEGVSLLMNGLRPAEGKVHTQGHADLVEAGRGLADVVLVDAPPALAGHEAGRLSAAVDSVVLLCEIGRVTARDAALTVDGLRRVGAPLHGVVLVAKPSLQTRLSATTARVRSDRGRDEAKPDAVPVTEVDSKGAPGTHFGRDEAWNR